MSASLGAAQGARPALTVVVPAYNEAANIEPVAGEILGALDRSRWADSYEVVLVDDGSADGTGDRMGKLAARHPRVVLARHARNRGFGAALRTGFATSRGEVVSFVTADGEVGVSLVLEMLERMGDHDLLLSGRERSVGADRHVLTWGFDLMVRLILGFWVDKDVGIYLVRGDLVRSMTLVSDTGLANLEVILQCRSRGGRIGKAGVLRARPRLSGASKVANARTVARTLWEMGRLRWRLRPGRMYNRPRA